MSGDAYGGIVLFALRRLYALAMIAEGFCRFFGVRTGWALAVARVIGRHNGRRMLRGV